MKKYLILLLLTLLPSVTFAMPNPASVYCHDNGGTGMQLNPDGPIGYCKFNDNSICPEFAFMNGDCKPGKNFLTKIKYRNKGVVVEIIQDVLIHQGYLQGQSDGSFGLKTKKAVINFQQAHNLNSDGVVGSQTLAEINKLLY